MDKEQMSFWHRAETRGPGKRQVKPSAALLSNDLAFESDESDDEDFFDEDNRSSDGSNDGDDDDDDENANDDEESDHSDASSNSGSVSSASGTDGDDRRSSVIPTTKKINDQMTMAASNGTKNEPISLICCLCLNLRPSVQDDDIIQCDKCGLSVHENCYMVETDDPTDSDISSSTTEPWFCEPCLYGLSEPPHCELCPNRFGAFKRSDIGGKWVHLLCALFTSGVTFGDVEHLSAVSWQEIDYRLFGKKSCLVCDDQLFARTGVVVQCDAALCRQYFHVTCAQRHGLLVDNSEIVEGVGDRSQDHVQVDPRFVTCKRHASDETAVRARKQAFARCDKYETQRMLTIKRKILTVREEHERIKQLDRHKRLYKRLEGVTIAWPLHEEKRLRLLHTSAEYLQAFQDKAELNGITRTEFENEFTAIKMDQLPYLPAAMSAEFIGYFQVRDTKVIPAEQERVRTLTQSLETLRATQLHLNDEYSKLIANQKKCKRDLSELQTALQTIADCAKALGCKNIKLPGANSNSPLLTKNRKRTQSHNSSSATMSNIGGGIETVRIRTSTGRVSDGKLRVKVCAQCLKSTDQHLLAHCETCKQDYHIACLDPPLAKMPKKTFYDFMCSKCTESSDDTASEELNMVGTSTTTDEEPRKLRHRGSLMAPRRADELIEAAFSNTPPKQRGRPRKLEIATSVSPTPKHQQQHISATVTTKRGRSLTNVINSSSSSADKMHHRQSNDDDNYADLVDGTIVTVRTTKSPKFRRMQYPSAKLQDAVTAVLKGKMNIKQAAECHGVPRSTVQRRISLSREEHRRAQSFTDEKERNDNSINDVDDIIDHSTMNGTDDNIDVGENPTPTDDVVDVEKIEAGGGNLDTLAGAVGARRRKRKAKVIVVEELNLA